MVSAELDSASLMQMMSKLNKRSHLAEDTACLEDSLEADHASMLRHHDFASAVRVRSRKDEDVEASASFFESEEDDHTSLLQSSMEKSEDSSLMQMMSKLNKRSQLAEDDACLDNSLEADHASMLQHHDFASSVRVRRKDADIEASATFFECEEDDHTSLLQSSMEKSDSSSLMQMISALRKRLPIVKDDVCPESIEADHASMLQHFDLSRRIRARSDDGGNASEVCGDSSEGDGSSFLQTSVATNE